MGVIVTSIGERPGLESLRGLPYFQDLNDQELISIHEQVIRRTYMAKEVIFREGEVIPGLVWVEGGRVALQRVSCKGREHILSYVGPGSTFADVPALDGGPMPVNVMAVEPSELAVLPQTALHALLRRAPTVAMAAIQKLTSQVRAVHQQNADLVFGSVPSRLARVLLDSTGSSAEARMTQEELAAMVGTVRPVAARALQEMEESGAIVRCHGRVRVLDRERLIQFRE